MQLTQDQPQYSLQERTREAQAYITKALLYQRNLGTRSAAGYLRNRGFSIEAALFILLGAAVRPPALPAPAGPTHLELAAPSNHVALRGMVNAQPAARPTSRSTDDRRATSVWHAEKQVRADGTVVWVYR
jgi:hypothetical protein